MRDDDLTEVTGLVTDIGAALRVDVSATTIRARIRSGRLPSKHLAGRRFIHPADLEATQTMAHVRQVVLAWRRGRGRAGWRLRQLRETAGMTQLELEAASGLRHETLSRLELGRPGASAETMRTLAVGLRVNPEQLISRDPPAVTLLTVAEAASRLGVPAGRVQTWLHQGELSGRKVSEQ